MADRQGGRAMAGLSAQFVSSPALSRREKNARTNVARVMERAWEERVQYVPDVFKPELDE